MLRSLRRRRAAAASAAVQDREALARVVGLDTAPRVTVSRHLVAPDGRAVLAGTVVALIGTTRLPTAPHVVALDDGLTMCLADDEVTALTSGARR